MKLNFSLAEASKLADRHKVVPLIASQPIGDHTPVSVFRALASNQPGSFLLESAEQGVWARYSFIGVKNRGMLTFDGEQTIWKSDSGVKPTASGSLHKAPVLDQLEELIESWSGPAFPGLPPLTAGLVGVIGWDMIRQLELLPNKPQKDFEFPVLAMAMFQDLVIFDHELRELILVSNIFGSDDFDDEYLRATSAISEMQAALLSSASQSASKNSVEVENETKPAISEQAFLTAIEKAKHYVRIGDVFQVVLSQRFDITSDAKAIDIYEKLRELNPSPYMYLLNFADENGDYSVVGSSPEALVKISDGEAISHPIAGSRPRGKTLSEDQALEESLTFDEKERAEHLMLVDLARNDLLRVCEPESVRVTEFMQNHKFSHIMHLVSTVKGKIRKGKSAVEVFKAAFPAGTLSGAPKPRALEIIDELETTNRGIYGGVVGYFDFSGNADLAIAIRTAFIRDGVVRVQAGAGIVLDSVPANEFAETVSKASAPIRALRNAEAGNS